MEQSTSFKLFFGDKDVRRVSLPITSFDEVVAALQKLYSEMYHPELRIQYYDAEGDKCTLSSQIEWEEMLQHTAARPIKLYISESSMEGRYFKDGPAPEARFFYVDDESQKVAPTEALGEIAIGVPTCLQRLFPGGKILPYNLPEWLRDSGCLTPKRVDPNDSSVIDLHIDVLKLLSVLNRQALKCFETTPPDYNKAKDFLYSVLDADPVNSLALYNLACAEALLGNGDAAMEALTKAVRVGNYADWSHMERDSDLQSLRERADFVDLVQSVKENDPEEIEKKRVAELEALEAEHVKREEEERKKREEEELKRVEEARKQQEEEERKKREEEEKKKREEEEKKKREEEEKKKQEEEECKKREEEEKNKREAEELAEKKRKAAEEVQKRVEASKYKAQLGVLAEMGFEDVDICEFLLGENKGDLNVTLSQLLEAYPKTK